MSATLQESPVPTFARLAHIPMPSRIAALPRDPRGYPVPAFVLWHEPGDDRPLAPGQGKPDFRIMDHRHLRRCIKQHVCWICGGPLGHVETFVIGPMCVINRVSSEPPSHLDCARYALKVCPFLAIPEMRRLPMRDVAAQATQPGFAIPRNPGVGVAWVCAHHRVFRPGKGGPGVLFHIGEPRLLEWYTRGRLAGRSDVIQSITSGFPLLQEMAEQDGPQAVTALNAAYQDALRFLPA